MSRPITDPKRNPPLHYLCDWCGSTSSDAARIVELKDEMTGAEPCDWECGMCGGQKWKKPSKEVQK